MSNDLLPLMNVSHGSSLLNGTVLANGGLPGGSSTPSAPWSHVPLNLQPAAYTMEIFKDFFKDVDGPTASCLIVKFGRVCAMVTLHTGGCNYTDIATYMRQVELFADLLNDMVCAEPVDMLEGDIIATVKALGPPFTSPISSRRRDGRRLSELLDRVVEVRGSLVALAGASASTSSGAAAARTVA